MITLSAPGFPPTFHLISSPCPPSTRAPPVSSFFVFLLLSSPVPSYTSTSVPLLYFVICLPSPSNISRHPLLLLPQFSPANSSTTIFSLPKLPYSHLHCLHLSSSLPMRGVIHCAAGLHCEKAVIKHFCFIAGVGSDIPESLVCL